MSVDRDMAEYAIEAAARHASSGGPHQESAELALADALACLDRGDYGFARTRAHASIRYSIGDPTQVRLPARLTPRGENA